jgi:hypothetical protein
LIEVNGCLLINGVGKEYTMIHVAVDIKKNLMSQVMEEVHDGRMLKKFVDNASENNDVKRVIADGAYDSKENFRYLFHNQIEAAVRVRKNSSINRLLLPPKKDNSTTAAKEF